jgi:hypothetical protein
MKKITKKILYFISGPAPSGGQIKQAMELDASFRNATLVGENECLEKCDAVCGEVPKHYQGFPIIDLETEPEPEKLTEAEELKKLLTEKGIAFKNNNSINTLKTLLGEELLERS